MDYPQYFATLRTIYNNFAGTANVRLPPSNRIDEGWEVFGTIGSTTNDVTHIRARKHGRYPVVEMTLDDFLAVNGIDITNILSG